MSFDCRVGYIFLSVERTRVSLTCTPLQDSTRNNRNYGHDQYYETRYDCRRGNATYEFVPIDLCPIAELTTPVVTRTPHSPVCFQHQTVRFACGDRLGACMYDVEVKVGVNVCQSVCEWVSVSAFLNPTTHTSRLPHGASLT